MGAVQSRKRDNSVNNLNTSPRDQVIKLEEYVIVAGNTSASKPSVLEFDPGKSRAICVGIDKQQHHKFLGNNLGNVAAKNAMLLGECLVTNMGMQKERVHVYTSDGVPELCKKEAIKALILNYMHEVEEDGVFIFYFSGHVVVYKGLDDKDDWIHVLVPADFAGDVVSGITADDFVNWVQQAKCKAHNILIILDCCYAGGIGKKISSTVDIRPQIHVMCACAAKEVTLPMNVLGNSIFCYFLLYVLKKQQPKGKFALHEDMDEIAELCQSFSSLLMCYSSERGGLLKPALIQPEMHSSGNDEIDADECDDNSDSHQLSKLFALYDKQARKPSLHLVARQWLHSRVVQDSLKALLAISPLPESLYDAIVCALFYSVSCIHLAYDRTHITERNLFITIAISIISAIGYTYPDVTVTDEQLMLGLKFYYLPINSVGIPTNSIERLFMELHVQSSSSTTGKPVDQNTVSNIMLCVCVCVCVCVCARACVYCIQIQPYSM